MSFLQNNYNGIPHDGGNILEFLPEGTEEEGEIPTEFPFLELHNAAEESIDPLSYPGPSGDHSKPINSEVYVKASEEPVTLSSFKDKLKEKKTLGNKKVPEMTHPAPPSQGTPFKNEKEFQAEMDKAISDIIDESLYIFQKDPREYHPYYLRIFKYVSMGQKFGYISTLKEVNSVWAKFDGICENFMRGGDGGGTFVGDESPYSTFIKTGKVIINGREVVQTRNEKEIKKRLEELEGTAKEIVEKWKQKKKKRGMKNPPNDIRSDLKTRLEFFEHCKSMTFPADCVAMNRIWTEFLNHFEAAETSKSNQIGSVPDGVVVKTEPCEIGELEETENLTSFLSCEPDEAYSPYTQVKPEKLSPKKAKIKQSYVKTGTGVSSKFKKSGGLTASTLKKRLKGKVKMVTDEQKIRKKLQLEMMLCKKPIPKASTGKTSKIKSESVSPSVAVKKERMIVKSESISPSKTETTLKKSKYAKPILGRPAAGVLNKPFKNNSKILSKLKKKRTLLQVSKTQHLKTSLEKIICTGNTAKLKMKRKKQSNKESESNAPLPAESLENSQEPIVEDDSLLAPCMCEECGEFFLSKKDVIEHKKEIHKPQSKCPLCPCEFPDGPTLMEHFKFEHTTSNLEKNPPHTVGKRPTYWSNDQKQAATNPPSQSTSQLPSSSAPAQNKALTEPKKKFHMKIKADSTFCEICGKTFSDSNNLRRHQQSIHVEQVKSECCPYCGKSFKTKDWLNAHIRQAHLGQSFRCDICRRDCQSAGKLWKHKVESHGMSDLPLPPGTTLMKCDHCGEELLRGMKRHMDKNHPGQDVNKFHVLNSTAGTWVPGVVGAPKLRRVSQMTPEQKKAYLEKSKLNKREARRKWREEGIGPAWLRKEGSRPYSSRYGFAVCPQCGVTLASGTGALTKHIQTEHGVGNFKCSVEGCNAIFLKEEGLKGHMRRQHFNLAEHLIQVKAVQKKEESEEDLFPEWKCVICSCNFLEKAELSVHFLAKHQQTLERLGLGKQLRLSLIQCELKCSYCDEKVNGEKSLRSHVETAHPEQCWNCPECQRLVTSPEDLQEHFFLSHMPPSEAPILAREFIQVARAVPTMRQDMSGLPPIVCPVCQVRFNYIEEVIQHVESEHPENVFKCGCLSPRITEKAYWFHMVNYHRKDLKLSELEPNIKNMLFSARTLPCPLCQSTFSVRSFKRHLKETHGLEENGNNFQCPCPKDFRKREFFMTHMEEMHGAKEEELLELVKKPNVTEDVDLELYRDKKTVRKGKAKQKKLNEDKPSKQRGRVGRPTKNKVVIKSEPESNSDSDEDYLSLSPPSSPKEDKKGGLKRGRKSLKKTPANPPSSSVGKRRGRPPKQQKSDSSTLSPPFELQKLKECPKLKSCKIVLKRLTLPN